MLHTIGRNSFKYRSSSSLNGGGLFFMLISRFRISYYGQLPMYFNDKYHNAIIGNEKREMVQELMSKKREIREKEIKKYPEDKYA